MRHHQRRHLRRGQRHRDGVPPVLQPDDGPWGQRAVRLHRGAGLRALPLGPRTQLQLLWSRRPGPHLCDHGRQRLDPPAHQRHAIGILHRSGPHLLHHLLHRGRLRAAQPQCGGRDPLLPGRRHRQARAAGHHIPPEPAGRVHPQDRVRVGGGREQDAGEHPQEPPRVGDHERQERPHGVSADGEQVDQQGLQQPPQDPDALQEHGRQHRLRQDPRGAGVGPGERRADGRGEVPLAAGAAVPAGARGVAQGARAQEGLAAGPAGHRARGRVPLHGRQLQGSRRGHLLHLPAPPAQPPRAQAAPQLPLVHPGAARGELLPELPAGRHPLQHRAAASREPRQVAVHHQPGRGHHPQLPLPRHLLRRVRAQGPRPRHLLGALAGLLPAGVQLARLRAAARAGARLHRAQRRQEHPHHAYPAPAAPRRQGSVAQARLHRADLVGTQVRDGDAHLVLLPPHLRPRRDLPLRRRAVQLLGRGLPAVGAAGPVGGVVGRRRGARHPHVPRGLRGRRAAVQERDGPLRRRHLLRRELQPHGHPAAAGVEQPARQRGQGWAQFRRLRRRLPNALRGVDDEALVRLRLHGRRGHRRGAEPPARQLCPLVDDLLHLLDRGVVDAGPAAGGGGAHRADEHERGDSGVN
mmetsp:Transcript_88646/g.235939  ORF Transcript_88646/g.235939 Transcript_88646/m.235939 type:complete len:636 (-) Transcript_88646:1490-3397(-)